jgi:hypothetical protein
VDSIFVLKKKYVPPFVSKNILLAKGGQYFCTEKKYVPPFASKNILLAKGGQYFCTEKNTFLLL